MTYGINRTITINQWLVGQADGMAKERKRGNLRCIAQYISYLPAGWLIVRRRSFFTLIALQATLSRQEVTASGWVCSGLCDSIYYN